MLAGWSLIHAGLPHDGREIIIDVLQILPYLLVERDLIVTLQKVVLLGIFSVAQLLNYTHTFDVSDLDFLYGVLALDLDLVLHLAQVSFQLLNVLLMSNSNLLEALAELVAIPLQLQVLRVSLVQLLR